MTISTPTKLTVPFAASGDKNTIPVPSQSGGVASYTAGFPPLTMTPKASGGVPPSGKDMNGILFSLSQAIQYEQAGGHFIYDSGFASTVGGYPVGAIVQSTDNSGFWVNSTANNSTDPEAFGAGWLPLKQSGATVLSVTSTNVTLTALQAAKDTFVISGTLTANVNIIVPAWAKSWAVVNNATMGAYSITIKTASGTGAILLAGANEVIGDGTNVLSLTYLLATKVYADASATTAATDKAIGYGQTWKNKISVRAVNTNYTNNTGKPILVNVSLGNAPTTYNFVTVDDISVASTSTETLTNMSFIVPNGSVYRYSNSSYGPTNGEIRVWAELTSSTT